MPLKIEHNYICSSKYLNHVAGALITTSALKCHKDYQFHTYFWVNKATKVRVTF